MLPSAAAAVALDDGRADGYLARLGGYDERDQAQVDRCLQAFLHGLIRSAWERGWTPADVVQHGSPQARAGRRTAAARGDRLRAPVLPGLGDRPALARPVGRPRGATVRSRRWT